MPQFEVAVAARDTGAESTIIITAADETAAAAHANDLGLMVKSVNELAAAPAPASIDLVDLLSDALDDARTYKRIRKLITRGVSEGVLVGTVLAGILLALLGSCLFMSFLPTRH